MGGLELELLQAMRKSAIEAQSTTSFNDLTSFSGGFDKDDSGGEYKAKSAKRVKRKGKG